MSGYEIEEKTPRYIFNGEPKQYATWAQKYMARATLKGFDSILKGSLVLRTTTQINDETVDATRKIDEEAVKLNKKGYNDLVLSVDTETAEGNEIFDLIVTTIDPNKYPDGNAKQAWDKIRLECEPTSMTAYVNMRMEFEQRTLKEGEKPNLWIVELEKMRKRLSDMKHPMSDEDFFIHIIGTLPLKYRDESKDFKSKLEADIKFSTKELTLKYIKNELKDAYEAYYKQEEEVKDEIVEEEDVALAAGGTGTFKGYCNNCGKYGHKSSTCPEQKPQSDGNNGGNDGGRSNGGRRFNGTCFYCGKRGHKKAQCWQNPENKKTNGQQNDDKDGGSDNEVAEIMLMAVEAPVAASAKRKYCKGCMKPEHTMSACLNESHAKKHYWADWCEESDDEDDEDEQGFSELVGKTKADDSHEDENDNDNTNEICEFSDDDGDFVCSFDDEHGEEFALTRVEEHDDVALPQTIDMDEVRPSDPTPDLFTDIMNFDFRECAFAENDLRTSDVESLSDESDDSSWYSTDSEETAETMMSMEDELCEHLDEFAMANINSGKNWAAIEMKLTNSTWIGDSAASGHMTNDDTGMYDCKTIHEEIKVGSGQPIIAIKVGKLRLRVKQTNGKVTVIELTNVKYVPELWCNLFSLTAAMDKGFDLGNKGRIITITKNDAVIGFDHVFATNSGFIMAAEMEQVPLASVNAMLEAGRAIDIQAFHAMYGHPGEQVLRNTAAACNLKLTHKLGKCESCALGKARQANTSKEPVERCDTPGKRLMIDISGVKKKSNGGNQFWLGILDDATDYFFSAFLKKKSDLSSVMIKLVRDLRAKGYPVEIIRCDRAGENTKFQENALSAGLGLTFEFTAPNTPQWNGRIERKFATLYGRTRSMMNAARITEVLRGKLWAEAASTATKLENLLVYTKEKPNSHEQFWKREAKYMRFLRTFGEMAVVTTRTKIKAKLTDRGKTMMFVGYADDSSGDTYRFYNTKTNKINLSRDVTWLNKSYGEYKGITATHVQHVIEVDDDDIDDDNATPRQPPLIVMDPGATPPVLTGRAAQDLEMWKPPDLTLRPTRRQTRLANANSESGRESAMRVQIQTPEEEEEEADRNKLEDLEPNINPAEPDTANIVFRNSHWPDLALHATERMMASATNEENDLEEDETKYEEPKDFQAAWHHPVEEQRKKWRTAIRKEFRDMINRGVWRYMKRRDLPNGRRCAKCKWVWKIKRNGVFRARLVVCGYSQIPGVDYQDHYAPVINDITWRILLIAMMIWNLDAWLIDVETAFLHGEFEEGERMFMDLPKGINEIDDTIDLVDDCIELLRTGYGCVQGARQWWKKCVSILRNIGFEGGDADPCLLYWNSPHGIVFIGLYVDDCLCIGKTEALKLLEEKLQENGLTVKTEKELTDYLSCDVKFNENKTKAILRQPHLLKTLKEDFGDLVKNLPKYRTPGTPGEGLVRSEEGVTVSPEEQKLYRSGTGKLLYLVKHSRPDIANAVRELSKLLDATTPRAMKEMKRIIKYVLDTPDLGLKIEPVIDKKEDLWRVVAFSDSDYAGDPDSRRSVSGYVIYLCGVPICWRSKAQRTVTLSSTEAEWIALSEVAKEVLFISQILKSMQVKIEYPIVIRVDNTAAIFLSNNVTTNQRTRHVDIRTKFVMQYTGPDGILKIVFVKGTDNDSDIMTKNVTGDLHNKHVPKMMNDRIDDDHETTN